MRFQVITRRNGVEETLGLFTFGAAEETVTRLACEAVGSEPFSAFVVPVPDDAEPPGTVEPERPH